MSGRATSDNILDNTLDNKHTVDHTLDNKHTTLDNKHTVDHTLDNKHTVDNTLDNKHTADNTRDNKHTAGQQAHCGQHTGQQTPEVSRGRIRYATLIPKHCIEGQLKLSFLYLCAYQPATGKAFVNTVSLPSCNSTFVLHSSRGSSIEGLGTVSDMFKLDLVLYMQLFSGTQLLLSPRV